MVDNLPWTSACAFAPRCSQPIEVCTRVSPELVRDDVVSDDRQLRCHNPVQEAR